MNKCREPRFHGTVTNQSHNVMSHIKGKDTSIEVILRKELWNRGIRYRKNYNDLPGRPDIVITKYKIVIFCDSEFFHGKDWEKLKTKLKKGSNSDYWIKKIERNIARDKEIDEQLFFLGWTVIHFWGKDIKEHTESCVKIVQEKIFDLMLDSIL